MPKPVEKRPSRCWRICNPCSNHLTQSSAPRATSRSFAQPGRRMLLQLQMIERTRSLCQHDTRILAALQYGSFTVGEADEFSDIEFAFFCADDALPLIDQAWSE